MINDNLLKLRKAHHLSQEEVAEKIGVSRQAVAKWETGATTPDIVNCAALAKLYDITLDELVAAAEMESSLPLPPSPGKYIFGTVTIGERGQIVIPVKARRVFHLEPGDDLLVLGDIERGLALMDPRFFLSVIKEVPLPGIDIKEAKK